MSVTVEQVVEALRGVNDPDLNRSLVELDMIKDVAACDGIVKFRVVLTTPACPLKAKIEEDCRAAVQAIPGVEQINVIMDAEVRAPFGDRSEIAKGVKNFIAVGSGKGGVGKSTCAINIAIGLAESGAKVGLLDCDVYGPSVPLLAGITREDYLEFAAEWQIKNEDQRATKTGVSIPPIEKFGLKIMTMGFLVEPDKAIVWRGPMVHGAILQFLRDILWGELDYLVIDLPPGTGDVQLTLSQSIPMTGAVVVCTPQDVALADARKSIQMFETTKTDILGLVENMAYFELPDGTKEHIFGEGGVEAEAKRLNVPFLGGIPLETGIRVGGDEGKPIIVSEEESGGKKAFREVIDNLVTAISRRNYEKRPRRKLKILKT